MYFVIMLQAYSSDALLPPYRLQSDTNSVLMVICIVQLQLEGGFDFMTVQLVDPAIKRPEYKYGQIQLPYNWSDLLLVSAQYSSQVIVCPTI